MRRKMIIATTAGALSLTGLAVAVPAIAAPPGTVAAASSSVDRITEALAGLVDDGSLTQDQADEVARTLADAGIGGRGGHGGRMDLSAAATALGTTEEELRTALRTEGTTLADVAEQQGVAVDTLVDALVEAQEERIAAAVAAGRLTQEAADQRLAGLAERVTERVETAVPARGGDGHGRRGPRTAEEGGSGSSDEEASTEEAPAD
ncbi:hypothetical protein [Blastococcus montanus]|uniref:hypothetical protein n=1 Tax=Blastococcus montanus TaxID=3144973 RepID=UPI0032080DB6